MTKETFLHLFYWSERKFPSKEKENYGDLLSKYLIEKTLGWPVKWVHLNNNPSII